MGRAEADGKKNNKQENKNQERLQKILAERGVASRRAAEKLIIEGRVLLNGRVAGLGDKADPELDEILLEGRPLPKPQNKRYVLLYKPSGYITSVGDPRGRRTVLDLLPELDGERLYPVGRLDYATSGALLLTNDGELTNALLHPKGEVSKVYECAVPGKVGDQVISRLEQGVHLRDGLTAPARVRRLKYLAAADRTVLELTIHEGRNRQVRRMLAAVGFEVIWLKRVSFAGIKLNGLGPGEWRELTAKELASLRHFIK